MEADFHGYSARTVPTWQAHSRQAHSAYAVKFVCSC